MLDGSSDGECGGRSAARCRSVWSCPKVAEVLLEYGEKDEYDGEVLNCLCACDGGR